MSLFTDMTNKHKTDLPQEKSQETSESEICSPEEDVTAGVGLDLHLEEDDRTKNLQTGQSTEREHKTINPLSLLKEDFGHFKDDLISVFKDKDARSQSADRESKSTSTLSLFKEDFYHFKEDLTSVFKIRISKEKDSKALEPKEDFSSSFKTNVLPREKAERTGRSRKHHAESKSDNLEGEDQTRCSNTRGENVQELTDRLSQKKRKGKTISNTVVSGEEEADGSKKTEDKMTDGMDSALNPAEDILAGELDLKRTETTASSETQQTETRTISSNTGLSEYEMSAASMLDGEDRSVTDESCEAFEDLTLEQCDDEPGEDLSGFKTLSSGISLLINHDSSRDIVIDQSGGELWSVKNFACYLTLDPNTASPELLLSEHNRTATRVWSDHRCPDHPERFDGSPQVLCREGLLEEVYWEVEWSGGADVGVTYNSISRAGDAASCLLGHNAKSWSLECCEGSYTPCHDNKRFRASSPKPFTHRVGVYLNWPAGSLSFFSVSSDAMTLLHTFSSTFTEPLYPAFWVWGSDASVSLRQVELDWERLLQ